ncbi:hypothetical protein L1887_00983 [Cichorium endivia]|nr:hypothetical protein L1887_00983 [Cichorium endivia]
METEAVLGENRRGRGIKKSDLTTPMEKSDIATHPHPPPPPSEVTAVLKAVAKRKTHPYGQYQHLKGTTFDNKRTGRDRRNKEKTRGNLEGEKSAKELFDSPSLSFISSSHASSMAD